MQSYAALFSGQGSQYPGMGRELYENFQEVREIYESAGDILGFDVKRMSFEGTEDELSRTLYAQPIIFTHSAACYAAFRHTMPAPMAAAGHSLGEFAALYCAGAYSLEDGLRIIAARARAMEDAAATTDGAMFAVVGGEADEVRAACEAADGFVLPVNFNLPSQTVISGETAAAERAATLLEGQGKKVVRLSVGSAFHTAIMAPAAETLKKELGGIRFGATTIDFYSNLTGARHVIDDYPAYFADHMVSPVRFVEQMNAMAADGITACIEFGPKKTACTLAKKNVKSFSVANVEDMKTLAKASALLA